MPRGNPRQLALTLAVLTGSVALAVWSAWPIYGTSRAVIVAAVGLAVGAGAALLARARSWSPWTSAALAFLGFLVVVVPAAVPSALGSPARIASGLRDAVAAVVLDWKRLLTIAIPVDGYQTLLVPFLALVVLCSWLALTVSFVRGRASSLAAVPMVAMVAFGAVFGSSDAAPPIHVGPLEVPAPTQVLIGGLTLALVSTWLIARARIDRADALRIARSQTATVRRAGTSLALAARRRLAGAGLVAAALVGAVLLAPATAALGDRHALREDVLPPEVIAAQPSPLTTYRGWFADGSFDAVLLTVSGAVENQRLRLTTLDEYDGQTFHVASDTARFARQPGTQSPDITVTIGPAFTGVWVPLTSATGGAPTFLGTRADALTDAYYADPALDTSLIALDGASEGVGLTAGDSLEIEATPVTDDAAFAAASGGDATVSGDDYPALAAWVDQQGLGRTGADLEELVARMRERGYLSHAARADDATAWIADLSAKAAYTFEPVRAGHTSAKVETLFQTLLDQELRAGAGADASVLVSAVGDDEQFSAAAAVLARYLGFESRVVVGVRLGEADPADGVPACDSTCTGANVTAWVEVRSAAGEWVPLDVTPQFQENPTRITQGESMPKNATQVDPPSSEVIEPPTVQRDEASNAAPEDQSTDPGVAKALAIVVTVVTAALGAVLLLAPLLVLPLAKRLRRRRRRHHPVAEVAMVGAWEELVDAYVDMGVEVPARLTRGELADLLGRDAAAVVATMVDHAVFAEHPPARSAGDAVWDLVDVERRTLAHEHSIWRRLGASMTPASFARRASRALPRTPALSHPGRRTHAEP
ncbi:transglutaminase-like domain-containing protein [Demequina capsici]|uniref:Transglutaminase-like domain-containing protein n=1 Tax=Demequina capsici TaxID=3075620 RepID=A0AA96FE46_9MICO|nr:transglutaminase-like domain-containing protein [Demequina sp. PMTSA13]WNM26921.1 transglutaminase-like domain-containing protein [Demequina sp. PMTSA13]